MREKYEELKDLARRYLDVHDEVRALKMAHIILDEDAPACTETNRFNT